MWVLLDAGTCASGSTRAHGLTAPLQHLATLTVPYARQDIPKIGQCIVQASAEKVSDHEVTLSTGQTLEFDYLVLAIGTDYKDKYVCSTSSA